MGCLAEESLLSLVEGSLPIAHRERALDHLAACDDCRRLVASLAEARPTTRLTEGEQVGRYTAGPLLGSGAMGVVYQARDAALGRDVALKLLRSDLHEERDDFTARLLREARTLARLSHPNVVAVHDVGTHRGDVFIAMELVRGVTLRQWLTPERPWREVVATLRPVAEALAAAHEAGIIHRDIKPDNVLVGSDGRPRLTDFGLAHGGEAAATSPEAPFRPLLSRAGALIGTPVYMAPELLAGRPATPLSDQYAFGVTLHEALFGRRPVEGATLDDLRSRAEAEVWREASMRGVPAWLRAATGRALRARPEERHGSMRELVAALDRGLSPWGPRWALAAAALVALVALGGAAARARASPSCGDPAGGVGQLWGPPTRASVGAAFSRVDAARAPALLRAVDALLSPYDQALARERHDACAATHLRRDQSPALLDARTACLDRRQREAEALVRLLGSADSRALDQAVEAASHLPAVADCHDRAALAAVLPVPADKKAQADRVEAQLAEQRARRFLVQPDVFQRHLLALLPEAEGVGHPGLLARTLLLAGLPPWSRIDLLERAAEQALRARDDATLADAWGALAEGHAREGHVEEAKRWASLGRAAVSRLGPDPEREAQLDWALAIALGWTADLDQAEALTRSAQEKQRAARGPDHAQAAQLEGGLGYFALLKGDSAAALEHSRAAVDLHLRILGDGGYKIEAYRQNLGVALTLTGHEREGIAELRKILERWPQFAFVRVDIATGLRLLHDPREAEREDRVALAACAELHRDECVALARLGLAEDLLLLGQPQQARELLEISEREATSLSPTERAQAFTALAEALRRTRDDPARRQNLADRAAALLTPLAERYGGPRAAELARARAAGPDTTGRPAPGG